MGEATRHLLLPTCSTRFTTMARARSQSTTTLCPLSSTSLAGSGGKEAWGAHTNHKSTSSSQGSTSPQRRVDKIRQKIKLKMKQKYCERKNIYFEILRLKFPDAKI